MKIQSLTPILVFLFVTVFFCLPVYENIFFWGQMDWDQFTFWNAVPRHTILSFHQFPLWNPYVNGGNVLLAHPHSPFLSPLYFIVMFFGPVIGLKIQLVLCLFIGLLGMFHLSRHFKASLSGAYLASFVFMLSSIYVMHLTEGHTAWTSMAFVPWFFCYYLKGQNSFRSLIIAILFLCLILLSGSVDVFSILIVFMVIYSVFKSFQEKNGRHVYLLLFVFLSVFLLCAIKLIPMLDFLNANPRVLVSDYNQMNVQIFKKMLLDPNQVSLQMLSLRKCLQMGLAYEWHEYGAYIGMIPLLLFLYGSIINFRKRWPLIVTGFVFLALVFGEFFPVNIWGVLHKFPIFESLTVTPRYMLGLIFVISILSGLGLSNLERVFKEKKIKGVDVFRLFSISIICFVLFDLCSVNSPVFSNAFTIEPIEIQEHDTFAQRYKYVNFHEKNKFFNVFGEEISRSSQYPVFLSNSGILDSYEIVHVKKGNIRLEGNPNYQGEVFLVNGDKDVLPKYISPNKIKVGINLDSDNTLVMNQNYDKGWKAKNNGRQVDITSYEGLVSIPLLEGRHFIELYYLPNSFLLGAFLSIMSMSVLLMYSYKNKIWLKEGQ